MATRDEVMQVIDTLSCAYPSYNPPNAEGLLNLWEQKFGEIPGPVLSEAASIWIDKSRFFPSISEIRDLFYDAQAQLQTRGSREADREWESITAERYRLERAYWEEGCLDESEWRRFGERAKRAGRTCLVDEMRDKYMVYRENLL
jgi:hypothetical protein